MLGCKTRTGNDLQGLTAWQCAVQDGNVEMMKALLCLGVDVNAKVCQVRWCVAHPVPLMIQSRCTNACVLQVTMTGWKNAEAVSALRVKFCDMKLFILARQAVVHT